MSEAHTFQRISAYVIDILIISLISLILTAWIPKSKAYEDAIKEESNIINQYTNNEISNREYIDKMYENRYIVDKESIMDTLISVVLMLGYFNAFQYYNKGQTIGKKIMHIKVVNKKGKEASYLQLLGRSLIIHGCFTSLLSVIILLFINSNQYAYTVGIIQMLQTIITIVAIIMVICRKDKKGIHDLICQTKVIEA